MKNTFFFLSASPCRLVCFRSCPVLPCRVLSTVQVLASQLLLVDEVMKAGKQMGQAPPGGPGGMMEE